MSEPTSENCVHASTVLSKIPDILTSPVHNGLAMMSIESGNYYGLDEIGMKVWELIDGQRTLGEICAQLVSEHDVTKEQCWEDVNSLADKMLKNQLVKIASA